jgi:hypothetical protein
MNNVPRTWRVQNPSTTLYAFHLRNDITTGSQKVRDDAHQLWEQCVALGEQYDILCLRSLKSQLRSYIYNAKDGQYNYNPANEDEEATDNEKLYQDDWLELVRKDSKSNTARQLKFSSQSRKNNLMLKGEIYPLRINEAAARKREQAAQEREQKLQLWIALAGTGLAVSGISSHVLSQPVETFINYKKPDEVCPNTTLSICLFYSFFNVLIHVAVGVAAATLLALIVWLMSKLSNRSST